MAAADGVSDTSSMKRCNKKGARFSIVSEMSDRLRERIGKNPRLSVISQMAEGLKKDIEKGPRLSVISLMAEDLPASFQVEEDLPPDLPVDRGWAWVILAAHFTVMLVTGSITNANSIFILEYVTMFNTSTTIAAAPLGIALACSGLGNMIVSMVLMPRLEVRTLVLVGALLEALCVASLFLAPNMTFILVVHVFLGFSTSLTTLPSTTLVSFYFKARRSLANAIASSGFSLSQFLIPPLIQYLIDKFGASGTFLIMAGISLQKAVAGCLMRPVSSYERRKSGSTSPLSFQSEESSLCAKTSSRLFASTRERTNVYCNVDGDEYQRKGFTIRVTEPLEEIEIQDCKTCPNSPKPTVTFAPMLVSGFSKLNQSDFDSDIDDGGKCIRFEAQGPFVHKSHSTFPKVGMNPPRSPPAPSPLPSPPPPSPPPPSPLPRLTLSQSRSMSEVSIAMILRNRLFLLVIMFVPLGTTASLAATYLPSLGVSKGLRREDAALLLTVTGSVGLVCRLLIGHLADQNLVKKTTIVATGTSVIGTAYFFVRFYNSFGLLAGLAVLQGMFGSVTQTLMAVVIIDLMGLSIFSKVLGLTFLIVSEWNASNIPFIGLLKDIHDSFNVPYYYIGVCQFLTTAILLMEPVVKRLEEERVKNV